MLFRSTDATVRSVLSVMATCGMYNGAGEWMYTVGLPAKSGVSGGILAVLPGQLGIGVFSPRLDERGNSVRGVAVCRDLSAELGQRSVVLELQGQVALLTVEAVSRAASGIADGPSTLILDLRRVTGFEDRKSVV